MSTPVLTLTDIRKSCARKYKRKFEVAKFPSLDHHFKQEPGTSTHTSYLQRRPVDHRRHDEAGERCVVRHIDRDPQRARHAPEHVGNVAPEEEVGVVWHDEGAWVHNARNQALQADVVVVSLVRNNTGKNPVEGIGFLGSSERSTVVFSRAERLLVVAGSIDHFLRFPDTTMYRVAERVKSLATKPKSGVEIVSCNDFVERVHWESLKRYHERHDLDQQHRLGPHETGRLR